MRRREFMSLLGGAAAAAWPRVAWAQREQKRRVAVLMGGLLSGDADGQAEAGALESGQPFPCRCEAGREAGYASSTTSALVARGRRTVIVRIRVMIVRVMTHPVVVCPVAVAVVVTVAVPADVDLHTDRHHVRLAVSRGVLREGAACAEQCTASNHNRDDLARSLVQGVHEYSPYEVHCERRLNRSRNF